MPLETKEIPALAFWIFLAGVSYVVAFKITGKVTEKVNTILA